MTYFTKYDYTIIKRHWVLLLFKYLKSLVFLLLAWFIYYISIRFRDILGDEILYFVLFPIVFLLVNYAFIKLMLGYIKFYNNLLIIYDGQLIVIKSSLFFKDDVEFIDINKITKLDTYCRGIFANLIGYGILVVEQQRDKLREFHFVPLPHKALKLLNEEKQKTIEERKKHT